MKYFCKIWFKKKGQKMNIKNFCKENCLEKFAYAHWNGKTNNEREKKSRVKWRHKVEIYCSSETNKYEQGDTTLYVKPLTSTNIRPFNSPYI